MKKVLIALALMSVAATPALANYCKEPITARHYTSEPKSERHAERMRSVPDLRQANDPYWSPCDIIRIMIRMGACSRVELRA